MARPRGKQSNASSTATPAKRAISSDSNNTPRRSSKRIKSISETTTTLKTTPKKSAYFEASTSPETDGAATVGQDDSGYEDEDASITEADREEDEEEESEEDEKPRHRQSKGSTRSKPRAGLKQELWRQGVRTKLAPGEEVFIELPKARSAGKIPYADDRIHPNTLLFLTDLKNHNEREWLKAHDPDFRQSENDWKTFAGMLTEKMTEADETIPELPVKDVIYRIYRDIRFSPDKTPYKAYFSASWSRTGRKGPYAGYYAQIQPKGQSLVGGGLWMPDADQLRKIRRCIDRKPHKLKAVLMDEGIRESFLKNAPADEKKVVKAFAAANKDNALKNRPKDYDINHPEIELLKLRNFTLVHRLSDEDVTGKNVLQKMTDLMTDLEPFVTFFNSVVMPDEESSDTDEGEEEWSGDDGETGENDDEDP